MIKKVVAFEKIADKQNINENQSKNKTKKEE